MSWRRRTRRLPPSERLGSAVAAAETRRWGPSGPASEREPGFGCPRPRGLRPGSPNPRSPSSQQVPASAWHAHRVFLLLRLLLGDPEVVRAPEEAGAQEAVQDSTNGGLRPTQPTSDRLGPWEVVLVGAGPPASLPAAGPLRTGVPGIEEAPRLSSMETGKGRPSPGTRSSEYEGRSASCPRLSPCTGHMSR